jgi:hypothetical protein
MNMTRENPYNYHRPVNGAGVFFGRWLELEAVREALEGKACLSFVGGPRSGLTSLLLHVASDAFRELCQASCGPLRHIYLQCETYSDPLSLVGDVLLKLGLREQAPPNWNTGFSRLITALDELSPERVMIALDDFEHVGRQAAFSDLIERLRALTHRVDLTLITATHTELKHCCHMEPTTSPFPNLFHVRYLGPFAPEEAQDFMLQTSSRSGIDLMPHEEQILELSGLQPYFLQMACWHYYEAIVGGAADLGVISQQFAQAAQPAYEAIWQHLNAKERLALAQLADGRRSEKKPAIRDLASLTGKGYVRWPASDPEQALFSAAFRRYVLNHSGPDATL